VPAATSTNEFHVVDPGAFPLLSELPTLIHPPAPEGFEWLTRADRLAEFDPAIAALVLASPPITQDRRDRIRTIFGGAK
jgi:hypothetical protein